MSWGEALRLTEILLTDPSSHVAAARAGWDYPLDRVDMTIRDFFDMRNAKDVKQLPKAYPRPWPRTIKRAQPDATLTHEDIVAAMRMAGHTAPIPERR